MANRLNHIIANGGGLVQLLKATAKIATGASSSLPSPVWKRQLLRARDPPHVSFPHREYDYDEEPVKSQDSVVRCESEI